MITFTTPAAASTCIVKRHKACEQAVKRSHEELRKKEEKKKKKKKIAHSAHQRSPACQEQKPLYLLSRIEWLLVRQTLFARENFQLSACQCWLQQMAAISRPFLGAVDVPYDSGHQLSAFVLSAVAGPRLASLNDASPRCGRPTAAGQEADLPSMQR